MLRASLRLCLVAAACSSAPALAGTGSGPPNILVLVADDMGVEQLLAYGEGNDFASTPTIDALAAEGVLFRNAWSYPLCTPTRATLMTGRYGFRNWMGSLMHFQGQALPLDEMILPEMLDAGTGGAYAHGAFGKWHLANESAGGDQAINLAGWSHFEGLGITNFAGYFDWIKITNGVSAHTTKYVTTDAVDSTLAWVEQQTSPWLAYVAFVSPHNPLHVPPADLHSVDLEAAGTIQADPRPYYKAMVEALDTEMGRLLEGLGAARENTVVVFLADNGTQNEAASFPNLPFEVKGTMYEGGVNVPLIVTGPPVAVPGSESDALVSTVDLFATVAEVAGVDLPSTLPPGTELDSLSLVPYLADPALASQRDIVYSEWFKPNGPGAHDLYKRAARNATHKLIQRTTTPDELYDLVNDPYEDVNLLEGPLSGADAEAYATLSDSIDDLILPWPAAVYPYGCGVNPPGTLTVVSGDPTIGQDLVFAIDNPFPTQLPGSMPLLGFSLKPNAAYPCGTLVPGFSMQGHGLPGEVLIVTVAGTVLPGPVWNGPRQPVLMTVPIPFEPSLLTASLYFEAAMVGAPGSPVSLGLSNALEVQFVQ